MAIRSLLFSSDGGTAEPVCQVLAGLGVEAEYCSEAVVAVQKVTQTPFQIVIIDWDNQPEAGILLSAARDRKASERPLTLAIVSDDISVPKALQAGANSILRKPLLINQVKDTLTTARDLLRAKESTAQAVAAGASAGASTGTATSAPATALPGPGQAGSGQAGSGVGKTLRTGEFLTTSAPAPGGQFVTDSEMPAPGDATAEPVDPLQNLEPVAASVARSVAERQPEPPPPDTGERRTLEWYLKRNAVAKPTPAPEAVPAATEKPEMLGFDQIPTQSAHLPAAASHEPHPHEARGQHAQADQQQEQKEEAKLFAHIAGDGEKAEPESRPRLRLGKGPIVGALALAACAVAAAPQAPWHPRIQGLWKHGQQSLHAWLNPQPVTTAPSPVSHENFGRPGDEYKMPVTENIPDATTDPSQIQVVPVVDPTAKKPNTAAAPDDPAAQTPGQQTPGQQTPGQPAGQASGQPAGQAAGPTDGSATPPGNAAAQPAGVQVQENSTAPQGAQPQSGGTSAPSGLTGAVSTNPNSTAPAPNQVPAPPASTNQNPTNQASMNQASTNQASVNQPPHAEATTTVTPIAPPAAQPVQKKSSPQYVAANTHVPSSLKSDMASMAPDASGNKPIDAAMPSIEPVAVSEAAERALLADQPAIAYPANAKGQQGTVILQVLIGRDGTVQDAKFQQGSFAFARAAIDGVKQWKFKPYVMNTRAVSVASTLTLTFKPGK